MPEYLHPGVYIEETSYRSKPIQGVSTSTAGFVGKTRTGPVGKPILVVNYAQFLREFGSPYSDFTSDYNYLGHAVRAFFENGGSRAYIVRVLATDATPSSIPVGRGVVLRLPAGRTLRGPTDRIPLNSLRGVAVGTVLRWHTRAGAADPFSEQGSMTVTGYDTRKREVTVAAADALPPGRNLDASHTFFTVTGVPPQTGPAAGLNFEARNPGVDGDKFSVEIAPTDSSPVPLTVAQLLRDRPLLETLAVPVPAGAVGLELSAGALTRVRTGDTITIGTEDAVITALPDAMVDLTPTAGNLVDYTGGTLDLIQRGASVAPTPIRLPGGGPDLSVAGVVLGNPLAAPTAFVHDAAAVLRPGDVVRLTAGGNSADITIDAITFAAGAPNVTFAALANNHPAPEIRLTATSDTNADMARVVVGDVTGLTAPFRLVAAESVAISNGAARESASVLLVNPNTREVLLSKANPAAVGQFASAVTPANWMFVERLSLGVEAQTTFAVASTSSFYEGAKIELDDGARKFELTVASVDPGARTITVAAPGLALGGGAPILAAADPDARRVFVRTLELEVRLYQTDDNGEPVLTETFSGLAWNPDPNVDAWSRNLVERINDPEVGSKLVQITNGLDPAFTIANAPTTNTGHRLPLINGSNGSALTPVDIIGSDRGPGRRTGIEALSERDDISLVATPGLVDPAIQQALITHCERLKYRFAVLDGRRGAADVSDIEAHRFNYDSKYAAYYAPWLKALDLGTGRYFLAPPSGYALGVYARSDTERGVHKAPANEVVRNVKEVELPFTNGEQDVLNPNGVNLIRELKPRGIRIWGARTISSDQEWKYVNVRRLFIYLEHSIDKGTQWVVFEPNSEALWLRVKETITGFLNSVWHEGMLMGTKPDDAFFVRCDRTTMTQSDIDNGRLICEIGVAPVMPAEFVIFRIGQFTANSN